MTKDAFVDYINVSRETLGRLEVYENLLLRWNRKINLVAASTVGDLWTRHFLDSAQLFKIASGGAHWVDLGSGGGFPGAVVAVLAAELRPDLRVTLVESDHRKAAFLRSVLRETGVEGSVVAKRAEEIAPFGANVLSARALAPLNQLLAYAQRHLAPDGRALFLKGKSAGDEIAEALENWRFHCDTYNSKTDLEAVILRIGEIKRV